MPTVTPLRPRDEQARVAFRPVFFVPAASVQDCPLPWECVSTREIHPSLPHRMDSRQRCPQALIDRRMDKLEATWFPALLRLQVGWTFLNHVPEIRNPNRHSINVWSAVRSCQPSGQPFCLERVEQHSSGRVQALESGRLALSEGSRVSRLPSGSRRLPFSIPAESSDLPVKRVFRDITALRLSKFPVPAVSVQVFVCLGEGQPGLVSWTC